MNYEKINVVCISNKKKADILELHRAGYCNLMNKHVNTHIHINITNAMGININI